MMVVSRWNRLRFAVLFAAVAPAAMLTVTPLAAQSRALPFAPVGPGPRAVVPYTPPQRHFAGERTTVRSAAASSGVTLHLSTVAVVLGLVILAILLF